MPLTPLSRKTGSVDYNFFFPTTIQLEAFFLDGAALTSKGIVPMVSGHEVTQRKTGFTFNTLWPASESTKLGLILGASSSTIEIPASTNEELVDNFPAFRDLLEKMYREGVSEYKDDTDEALDEKFIQRKIDSFNDHHLSRPVRLSNKSFTLGLLWHYHGFNLFNARSENENLFSLNLLNLRLAIYTNFTKGSLHYETEKKGIAGQSIAFNFGTGILFSSGPIKMGLSGLFDIEYIQCSSNVYIATVSGGFLFHTSFSFLD